MPLIINIVIPVLIAAFVIFVIVKNVQRAKKGEGCSGCTGRKRCHSSCGTDDSPS